MSVEVSPVPLVDIFLGVRIVSVVFIELMLLLLLLLVLLLLVLLVLLEVIVSVRILSFSVISSRDVTIGSNGLTIRMLNVPERILKEGKNKSEITDDDNTMLQIPQLWFLV